MAKNARCQGCRTTVFGGPPKWLTLVRIACAWLPSSRGDGKPFRWQVTVPTLRKANAKPRWLVKSLSPTLSSLSFAVEQRGVDDATPIDGTANPTMAKNEAHVTAAVARRSRRWGVPSPRLTMLIAASPLNGAAVAHE